MYVYYINRCGAKSMLFCAYQSLFTIYVHIFDQCVKVKVTLSAELSGKLKPTQLNLTFVATNLNIFPIRKPVLLNMNLFILLINYEHVNYIDTSLFCHPCYVSHPVRSYVHNYFNIHMLN